LLEASQMWNLQRLFSTQASTVLSAIEVMPRYLPPLTFLTQARPHALPRSSPQIPPAYRPRISVPSTSLRCSISARTFATASRNLDNYTPNRLQHAVWPYIYKQFDKMAQLDSYFKQVDSLQDAFIERLREAVAIPSISSEDKRRPDVVKVRS